MKAFPKPLSAGEEKACLERLEAGSQRMLQSVLKMLSYRQCNFCEKRVWKRQKEGNWIVCGRYSGERMLMGVVGWRKSQVRSFMHL